MMFALCLDLLYTLDHEGAITMFSTKAKNPSAKMDTWSTTEDIGKKAAQQSFTILPFSRSPSFPPSFLPPSPPPLSLLPPLLSPSFPPSSLPTGHYTCLALYEMAMDEVGFTPNKHKLHNTIMLCLHSV